MALEQRDKELVAIGASVGALCRPCIDHHVPAGRTAGLTEADLARAVELAQETQRIAQALLFRHADRLVDAAVPPSSGPRDEAPSTSPSEELVRLGASLAANCHSLLDQHIKGCLEQGLSTSQVRSAIKMAEVVQHNAAEITARKAATAIETVEPDRGDGPVVDRVGSGDRSKREEVRE